MKTKVIATVLLMILGVHTGMPRVLISSHKEIPIIDGLFWMGPSTDFSVPFTLTQRFDVPAGATEVYGTIAYGPCEAAEFMGATAGYEAGGFPTPACSWIRWNPAPDIVTVTVEYNGNWIMNYVSHVRWEAYEDGNWVPYCLLGDPPCGGSLYMESQPLMVYLPLILKEY